MEGNQYPGWHYAYLENCIVPAYFSSLVLTRILVSCILCFTVFATRKLCIHLVYKKCTRCIHWSILNVYKLYTKCIPPFDKLLYTFCIKNQKNYTSQILHTKCLQTFVEMWYRCFMQTFFWNVEYILYTNMLYTFCIHFVCKMYTRVCRNMGYILHSNILYTFFIYQFWSTKSAHHKHHV